jgi:hypothetical protein
MSANKQLGPAPTAIRKGRFLWRDESEQATYLAALKQRIETGYFYSEKIIANLVDELAPVVNDCIDHEIAMDY